MTALIAIAIGWMLCVAVAQEVTYSTANATSATTSATTSAMNSSTGAVSNTSSLWCEHCARPVSGLQVPDDFCMCLFATVKTPRVLDFAPNGDLFVGSPQIGTPGITDPGLGGVYVLYDDDSNGVADDEASVFLKGAPTAHGVLLHGAHLYYTDNDNVYRLPYTEGLRKAPLMPGSTSALANLTRVAELAAERYTHTLAVDTSGNLFVSSGRYDTDKCVPNDDPRSGAVLRVGGDAPLQGTVVVENCRNPMFIRCETWGACYAMELSGDGWGGQNGAEKLVRFTAADAAKPRDVGYPCCVRKGQREALYSPNDQTCEHVVDSEFEFRLGDTPFQFDWDRGLNFPPPHTGALFIAMHGAFQTWTGAGIQVLPWDATAQKPAAGAKPVQLLPDGFGRGGKLFGDTDDDGGRASGLRFHPDGRLFVSDDRTGKVFWLAPKTLRRTGPRQPPRTASSAAARRLAPALAFLVFVNQW